MFNYVRSTESSLEETHITDGRAARILFGLMAGTEDGNRAWMNGNTLVVRQILPTGQDVIHKFQVR